MVKFGFITTSGPDNILVILLLSFLATLAETFRYTDGSIPYELPIACALTVFSDGLYANVLPDSLPPPSLNFCIAPPPFLFKAFSLLRPIDWTAFLRTTNSPAVSLAGTVSVSPEPGTYPPVAKCLIGPPS